MSPTLQNTRAQRNAALARSRAAPDMSLMSGIGNAAQSKNSRSMISPWFMAEDRSNARVRFKGRFSNFCHETY